MHRRETRIENRKQQHHAAADTGECEANANRSVETEMRNNLGRNDACAKNDHNGARKEQPELHWREVEAFDQDARQCRKHCNSAPKMRLTVAAGTTNRRSVESDQ